MRPYIICHMLSSLDGKIDGAALRGVSKAGEYEATGATLEGDGWICGRMTMQQHFAEDELFISTSDTPAGPQPVHVARKAKSDAISVDTTGKLRWAGDDLDGDHRATLNEFAVIDRAPRARAILRTKNPNEGASYEHES